MIEAGSSTNTVRYLMSNAAKFSLLTGEQEIQLARKVQAMLRMLELPESKRPEDWTLTVRQGQRAKSRMIESNLRLVLSVAIKYRNMGLPLEGLIQEGSLGLNRGVEKYDPERGYKASTYLVPWIKQGITRALEKQSRIIRLPGHIKQRTQKLKQLTREYMQQNGTMPSAKTLRAAMELNEAEWNLLISSLLDATSYDISVSTLESEKRLIDNIPSVLATPQERLDTIGERERVEKILGSINERHAKVLRLHFGLDNGEGKSMIEISQILGISRERVRQIVNQGMQSARKVVQQTQMTA
jgi:RNA polymerase sigma factor (sigma-70 family)